MLKIILLLTPLFFLSSYVLCQEPLRILTLHRQDSSSTAPLQPISQTMAVSLDGEKLNEVSTSILMAEKWLRTRVLSRYPSTNINAIVVTNSLLCGHESFKNQEQMAKLTLQSMKNIHHSLTRWGLEKKIKVSVFLESNCLQTHRSHLHPVFDFLNEINSTYSIKSSNFQSNSNELNVFNSKTVNLLYPVSNQAKPTSRKLSFIDPLNEIFPVSSPTSFSFSLPPETQPPASPPCNAYPHPYGAAAPAVGREGEPAAAPAVQGLWCVAKPSVPSEKLQVAMDYACGQGGADCGPIGPEGSCYSPDSVVAHASYAFNSYWQKNKRNGGMCGFEGTAMLITSDPSFLHCHFNLD